MWNWMFFILVGCLVYSRIYSTPVLNGNESDQQITDDVKDLESLRTDNNKPNITNSEHTEDLQDHSSALPSAEEDGEPQTNSRSAIFRHRGITQAKKSRNWNEKAPSDVYTKFTGIQYSPTDLAEYVFRTGDEEGVAVAVEELVREGMMGRTDAINYLQDVKQILTYMKDQYEMRTKEEFRNKVLLKPQRFPPREQYTEKRESAEPAIQMVTTEHPHQAIIASTSGTKETPKVVSTTVHPKIVNAENLKDDDSKRHVPPTYGFTLEVIYKLAKDMFTQSIIRDDPTAEETLSGLVTFLESEVGNKRISPAMKEKVLEIVSAALVDSLREYQGMISENRGSTFDEAGLYQHLVEANRPPQPKLPMSNIYHKLSVKGKENMLQLPSNSNRPKSS